MQGLHLKERAIQVPKPVLGPYLRALLSGHKGRAYTEVQHDGVRNGQAFSGLAMPDWSTGAEGHEGWYLGAPVHDNLVTWQDLLHHSFRLTPAQRA